MGPPRLPTTPASASSSVDLPEPFAAGDPQLTSGGRPSISETAGRAANACVTDSPDAPKPEAAASEGFGVRIDSSVAMSRDRTSTLTTTGISTARYAPALARHEPVSRSPRDCWASRVTAAGA